MATVGLGSGATPTAFTNDDKEPMTVKQECECQQYPRAPLFFYYFFFAHYHLAGSNGSLAILLSQCPSRPSRLSSNGVSKKENVHEIAAVVLSYLFHSISIKRR